MTTTAIFLFFSNHTSVDSVSVIVILSSPAWQTTFCKGGEAYQNWSGKHTELLPQHPILVHLVIQMFVNNARKDIDILLKFSKHHKHCFLQIVRLNASCYLVQICSMIKQRCSNNIYITTYKSCKFLSLWQKPLSLCCSLSVVVAGLLILGRLHEQKIPGKLNKPEA